MLAQKHQIFLMELLRYERKYGRGMTRKEFLMEKACSGNSVFYGTMKGLTDFGYVIIKRRSYSLQQVYYCLTSVGKIIANIFALQKNNDKKYKEIAEKGSVLWLP